MPQLLRGASVVCLPESDIDGFFAALDEYRITWLTAVPTVHREILRRAPDFHEAVLRNRLRFIRVNSGQLEPDEVDRFEQTFGVPLLMGFGLTEFLMITQDPLPPRMRKRGSVGLPLCNQVAIMSEAGAICATGDVGEIVVRGPMVFEGYFDDAQATAAAFVDGWFRTGDLGRFDEEGYLYLVGRIKDLINRGGEKISPVEIDAAIEAVPGVRAAATFAIPHHSLGEEIVAAVVRDGDMAIEASDIIDQVRRRMGPTRVPRKIYFVDQLPRTDSGKVRRSELPRLLGLDQADAAVANESAVVGPAPISPLEAALVGLWSSVLQVSSVGVNNDFFLLGGDSIKAMRLTNQLQQALGEVIHPTLLFTTPTISQMADYLQQHYFDALAAHNLIDGQNHLLTQMRSLRLANEAQIDSSAIAAFRGRLPVQASPPLLDGPPNPPAIFVLSPGRSGTTLLRVLLAGHPRLFAPPELHLLRHNTLLERKAALTGPQRFRLEGALRALMQANACDLPTAQQLMAEMEARDISVQGFYARLQHAIGNQILVDNTPNYALDPAALHRADVTFRQPYYIHLLRSPYGMIHSWDETHMDQVYPYQQIYSPRRIAELIWLISHQHILAFLAGVPGERHYRLRFEDLLRAPEREIRALCRFLHIDFVPTMLQPYADKQQRMTDGLHPESRMIGDVKFHQHQGIDPSVADRWRAHYTTDFLSDMTWEVAEILGYQRADLHRARIA